MGTGFKPIGREPLLMVRAQPCCGKGLRHYIKLCSHWQHDLKKNSVCDVYNMDARNGLRSKSTG